MQFRDIIGQEYLKEMLVKAVDGGRISHAQLFSGESGYGVLPLAIAYAQYINCTAKLNGDSCGRCASCIKMADLVHPDIHFVFPVNSAEKSSASKATSVTFLPQWRSIIKKSGGYFTEQDWYDKIEIGNKQGIISRVEADEIIKTLSFKSFEAEYKVMFIWMPEKMNIAASNALLKLLEEPWDKTLFLLISEKPSKLLKTITSRAQEIVVPRLSDSAVIENLKLCGVSSERVEDIARVSCGDIIKAKECSKFGDNSSERENFDLFTQLMRFSYNDRHMELLEWAEVVAALGREEKRSFFSYSIRLLRESYMMNAGLNNITYLHGEERAFCSKFSPFIGNHNIENLVKELELARAQIAQNGNPKMIMAHMALVISKQIVRN